MSLVVERWSAPLCGFKWGKLGLARIRGMSIDGLHKDLATSLVCLGPKTEMRWKPK